MAIQIRPQRSIDETQLESMEKERQNALEVAQEEDEKEKARPEDEKAVMLLGQIIISQCGGMG